MHLPPRSTRLLLLILLSISIWCASAAGLTMSEQAQLNATFSRTYVAGSGTAPYKWSITSGTLPTGLSLNTTTGTISGTLTQAGMFIFRLTVTDSAPTPASLNYWIAITVVAPTTTAADQPPSVTATASPTSGTAPLAVAFKATASDPDGSISSYAWSFGDGGTSTSANPSHTYSAAGVYSAKVTVTDNAGLQASSSMSITVNAVSSPTVTATANPSSGTAPLTTTLQAAASDTGGTITSYSWNFGDGTSGTGASASHTYNTAGTYSAVVTVTDSNGLTASNSAAVNVGSATTSSFNYVMGSAVYAYSTQAEPAKGGSYTDSAFHTTVTRITDWSKDNPSKTSARVDYSTWNPLSSDGKYLLFMTGQGQGYALWYASAPYAFYKDLSGTLQSWNSQDPEPRWDHSGSHPTWLYYRKDKQLRCLDVETNQDTLVHDFTNDFPSYGSSYYIWNGEEGDTSADSRYWAFMLGSSNSNIPLVFTYDKTANAVVAVKNITTGSAPNNVSMSPSGSFVYVAYSPVSPYTGDMSNPGIYTRTFANFHQSSTNPPHASWVYSAQGHEGIVNLWPSGTYADYLCFTRADTGQVYKLYYQGDMGWNAANLLHMNGPAAKHGWAFMSTYSANYSTQWVNNQIFAIEVDENKVYGNASGSTPRIWRIAFTQNIVGSNYYFQQPNAAIDSSGTRIWWGSDWRNTSSQNQDVMQVTLPANWWQDLANMP